MKNKFKLKPFWNKTTLLITALSLSLNAQLTALADTLAAGSDPFAKVNKTSTDLTSKVQGVAVVVAILCLVVAGVLFMFPSKKLREAVKGHIGAVVAGLLLVFGAAIFAAFVATWWN